MKTPPNLALTYSVHIQALDLSWERIKQVKGGYVQATYSATGVQTLNVPLLDLQVNLSYNQKKGTQNV